MLKFFPRLATQGIGFSTEDWDATAQVSGSNFTTNSTTLTDITGLTFAAAINSLYEVEALLKVRYSGSNGLRGTIACSASGSTGEFLELSNVGQNSTPVPSANVIGTEESQDRITTPNVDAIMFFRSTITTVGNTGNITAQVRGVPAAGTITVYIGSIMKIKKLA